MDKLRKKVLKIVQRRDISGVPLSMTKPQGKYIKITAKRNASAQISKI